MVRAWYWVGEASEHSAWVAWVCVNIIIYVCRYSTGEGPSTSAVGWSLEVEEVGAFKSESCLFEKEVGACGASR